MSLGKSREGLRDWTGGRVGGLWGPLGHMNGGYWDRQAGPVGKGVLCPQRSCQVAWRA